MTFYLNNIFIGYCNDVFLFDATMAIIVFLHPHILFYILDI
jgi:hypothetical protein